MSDRASTPKPSPSSGTTLKESSTASSGQAPPPSRSVPPSPSPSSATPRSASSYMASPSHGQHSRPSRSSTSGGGTHPPVPPSSPLPAERDRSSLSSAASFTSSSAGGPYHDDDDDAGEGGGGGARGRGPTTPVGQLPPSSVAPGPPTSYARAVSRGILPRQQSQVQSQFPSDPAPGARGRARSSSRTLTATRRLSKAPVPTDDADDGEDDEVTVLDRGEELVRKRMKERRAQLAQRGLSYHEGGGGSSSTPGGAGAMAASTPMGGPMATSGERPASRSRTRERDSLAAYGREPSSDRGAGGYFPSMAAGSPLLQPTTPSFAQLQHQHQLYAASISSRSERGGGGGGSVAGSITDERREEEDRENALMGEGGGDPFADHGGSVRGVEEEDDEDEDGEGTEGEGGDGDEEDDEEDSQEDGDVELTLRDRQDAINIEHPFGLPIWKPALYKKSRSVTRNAETSLHSIPSAAAQRHLLPGNLVWVLLFGWWLAIVFFLLAGLIWCAELGGGRYSSLVGGLGWYIGWPFGKYVEGEGKVHGEWDEDDGDSLAGDGHSVHQQHQHQHQRAGSSDDADSTGGTVKGHFSEGDDDDDPVSSLPLPLHRPDSGSSSVTVRTSPAPALRSTAASERTSLLSSQQQQQPARNRSSVGFTDEALQAGHGPSPSSSSKLFRASSYGATNSGGYKLLSSSDPSANRATLSLRLGMLAYWLGFTFLIAPLMVVVCLACWGLVVTIPMAKLTWELLQHLYLRPLALGFRPAPTTVVASAPPAPSPTTAVPTGSNSTSSDGTAAATASSSETVFKRERLRPGQAAPTGGPRSTVLLCTYRAVGLQYYKYTVGGVNIFFINLLPLVFFVIFDAYVLLPLLDAHGTLGPILDVVASRLVIFVLAIASVIPLSYFIGMAVASISAQSSIGMGAVINATFGSIIEILLYSIALTQGKGRLVEGSIVGSLLAGVLLMPGMSMLSGAFRRKEQKFNAKSAGVTSTMLIMAIIGTLTPTLFYQTYGSFELSCTGCPSPSPAGPSDPAGRQPWMCQSCHYSHPDPAKDPFYQASVKNLMYFCAGILLFSYLIGLWFSLRTHASQIWQNPQQLLQPHELVGPASTGALHPAHRASVFDRLAPAHAGDGSVLPTSSRPGSAPPTRTRMNLSPPPGGKTSGSSRPASVRRASRDSTSLARSAGPSRDGPTSHVAPHGTLTPYLETLVHKTSASGPAAAAGGAPMPPLEIPGELTPEAFHRAVDAAAKAQTMQALRHVVARPGGARPVSMHPGATAQGAGEHHEEGGGHEGPSWSRLVSASVLLGCTVLYAVIAEILVSVVDVILEGSGIDEKFLGITLFALVPNTTEFMNAMSFALNGNIALSMEIGSAYALQVCLLQIPAMVAFSALYDPKKMGEVVDTFTLIFPQFDCISIIFSIFLLTYTYIEARSNYHRGSILILAYLVLAAGFYYAPYQGPEEDSVSWPLLGSLASTSPASAASGLLAGAGAAVMDPLSTVQKVRALFVSLFV